MVCVTNNDQKTTLHQLPAWVRLSNRKRCASIGLNLEKRMESFPVTGGEPTGGHRVLKRRVFKKGRTFSPKKRGGTMRDGKMMTKKKDKKDDEYSDPLKW